MAKEMWTDFRIQFREVEVDEENRTVRIIRSWHSRDIFDIVEEHGEVDSIKNDQIGLCDGREFKLIE